jgi:hypothetical protein
VKKVSLEEIRAAQNELAAEEAQAKPAAGNKPGWGSKGKGDGNGNAPTAAERGGLKLLEWLKNSATKVGDERDGKRVNEVLDQLTKLNALVDRAGSIEEALRLIEEAKLG